MKKDQGKALIQSETPSRCFQEIELHTIAPKYEEIS
jgi:hypothetical protein